GSLSTLNHRPSLMGFMISVSTFLEHGSADVTLTLNLITGVLDSPHDGDEIRWFDGRNFIQFVLRVDTDPTCDARVKKHSVDLFDRLMERYGDLAESILAEWDRR